MESLEEEDIIVDSTSISPDRMENNTRKKRKQKESTKPVIEKKRRQRINNGLEQLKGLVLEATNSKGPHFAKLEKADILEMTVQYLSDLTKEGASAGVPTQDSDNTRKYNAGFNECASEVFNFISSQPDLSDGAKQHLIGHLAGCLALNTDQSNQQQQDTDPLRSGIAPQQGVVPPLPVRPTPISLFQTEANPYSPFAAHPSVLHHHSASRGSGAPLYTAPVLHVPKLAPSSTIVSHTPGSAFPRRASSVEDVVMTDCSEESSSSSSPPSMHLPAHAGNAPRSHSPRAELQQDTRTGFVRSSRVWNPPSKTESSSSFVRTKCASDMPSEDCFRQIPGQHQGSMKSSSSLSAFSAVGNNREGLNKLSANNQPWRPW